MRCRRLCDRFCDRTSHSRSCCCRTPARPAVESYCVVCVGRVRKQYTPVRAYTHWRRASPSVASVPTLAFNSWNQFSTTIRSLRQLVIRSKNEPLIAGATSHRSLMRVPNGNSTRRSPREKVEPGNTSTTAISFEPPTQNNSRPLCAHRGSVPPFVETSHLAFTLGKGRKYTSSCPVPFEKRGNLSATPCSASAAAARASGGARWRCAAGGWLLRGMSSD